MRGSLTAIVVLLLYGCASGPTPTASQTGFCGKGGCANRWYQVDPSSLPKDAPQAPSALAQGQMPPQPPHIEWFWWQQNQRTDPSFLDRFKAVILSRQG
jgi:hypothetical protein